MQLENALAYRGKTHKKAEILLTKLLPDDTQAIKEILIIGAGSFPSFEALSSRLSSTAHYTLVEPDQKQTDLFSTHFAKGNITIVNADSKTFLQNTRETYDLIYFEHPETMTLPLILGQLGVKTLKRVASFRESFAYLSRVLKQNSMIIASCMSKHECAQLKSLLRFSLQAHAKTFSKWNIKDFFYGGPYSTGLACTPIMSSNSEKTIERAIKHSHILLCVFLLGGLLAYIFYCKNHLGPEYALQRLIMVFVWGSQLYLHQPGMRGFFIKVFLFLLQIALFI